MVCSIANIVNKGEHSPIERNILKNFGARGFTTGVEASLNPDTLENVAKVPITIRAFTAKYKRKNGTTAIAKNYIYSGIEYSHSRGKLLSKGSQINDSLPGNLTIDTPGFEALVVGVESIFNADGRSVSPIVENRPLQVSITSGKSELYGVNSVGTFIITQEAVNGLIGKAHAAGYPIDNVGEAAQFLTRAALERGFDVALDAGIGVENVIATVRDFNNSNDFGADIISEFKISDSIQVVESTDDFLTNVGKKRRKVKKATENISSDLLNGFLTPRERTRLNKRKKLTRFDKEATLRPLIKAFNKVAPGLEFKPMSTYEIESEFGPNFSNKKGFVIGGKVYINLDRYSNETMFHEFSHFFFKWLKINNPTSYSRFMKVVATSKNLDAMRESYAMAHIAVTEEEILEEIAVTEIGMNVAKEFDKFLGVSKELDEDVDYLIEEFVKDFSIKLVGTTNIDSNIKLTDTVFDIFSFQAQYGTPNADLMFKNQQELNSLFKFSFNSATLKEGFEGMTRNGMIKLERTKSEGAFRIKLFDKFNNPVNKKGEFSKNNDAGLYYNNGELSIGNAKLAHNERTVDELNEYLTRFVDEFDTRFEGVSLTTQLDVRDKILDVSNRIKLNSDETGYIIDGVTLNRATSFIETAFEEAKSEEEFVWRVVWSDLTKYFRKIIKDKEGTEISKAELEERVITAAKNEVLAGRNSPTMGATYHRFTAEAKEIFAAKQSQGTMLHNMAEFLIRSMNFTQGMYPKNSDYNRAIDKLVNIIASKDRNDFKNHFTANIFNKAKDKTTPEFLQLMESYEFALNNIARDDVENIEGFLKKLKHTITEDIINDLDGPLTFLPEVKVASKKMGVSGTIDLLVIDRYGKAHIYDYKTKETGKSLNWDYPTEVMFLGSMGAFRSNARMKASVQTSLYAVMLNEMGITTGDSKVLYVEGDLVNTQEESDADTRLRYSVQSIKKVSLTNVTAEIQKHFEGKVDFDNSSSFGKSAIKEVINNASGYSNSSVDAALTNKAKKIVARASKAKEFGKDGIDISSLFSGGVKTSTAGMTVKLPGDVRYKIPANIKGDDAIIEHVKEVLLVGYTETRYEENLTKIFNGEPLEGVGNTQINVLKALTRGTSEVTHEIIKMSSDTQMGDEFSGITLLKDKVTGTHRMIVYNSDLEDSLPFGGDKSRWNIFGKYQSNSKTKQMFPNNMWRNTNHNMRLLKAGLGIMKMKKKDPNFMLDYITSNVTETQQGVPRMEDLDTILAMSKALIDIMIEHGETVPAELMELINDPAVTDPKNYVTNPLKPLSAYLEGVYDNTMLLPEGQMFKGYRKNKVKKALAEAIEEYRDSNIGFERLLKALSEFRHSLENTISSEQQRQDSQLWKLTDDAIMFLYNFNPNLAITNPNFAAKYLMMASGTSNTEQTTYNRTINAAGVALRKEFMDYSVEKMEVMDGLKKLHGITDLNSRVSFSNKGIFKNLFKDPTNSNRKEAFKLKSVSEVSSKAEKDAIIFFRKMFEKYAKESMHKKRAVPEGWMPLVPKSKLSAQSDSKDPIDLAKTFLFGTKRDKKNFSPDDGTTPSDDMSFIISNPFEEQMPSKDNTDVQWTFSRRNRLGLNEFGDDAVFAESRPLDMIEDNLENVLDTFVMGSVEAKHYENVSMFGRALLMNIKRYEETSSQNLATAKEIVTVIQKKLIKHETSEKAPAILNGLAKFTTFAVITGSIKQVMLETFTNPMVTSANYMADKIYGTMFKGQRQFSAKSYAQATKMVFAPHDGKNRSLIEAIDNMYGITTSDNSELKKVLSDLEGKSLFQNKSIMYMNKFMLDSWQRVTLAAWLIEKGSLDAYSLDEYGNLNYDEKKDRRFFSPSSDIKKRTEKRKIYEAVKQRLINTPGALTGNYNDKFEDRQLKWGLAQDERNQITALMAEVYSSMTEEAKSLATFYTGTQLLSKMRSWIFPKNSRYFKKAMTKAQNESQGRLVKVVDPNNPNEYSYKWEGTEAEGIVYSVQALYHGIKDQGIKGYKNGYNLKDHQKENLSKLMADLGMWLFLAGAGAGVWAYLMDDEQKKDPFLSTMHARYMAATGDVFLLASLGGMVSGQGSMMISLSVASNAITDAFGVLAAIPNIALQDEGLANFGTAVNDFAATSVGLYKSGEMIYDQMEHLSKVD